MWIALLFGLLVSSAVLASESARECPTDSGLRAQALRKQGTSGNITWMSLAIPEKAGSDKYCYERSVSVSQATYVHWPLAGMSRLFVRDKFTTANCCWPGARAERGVLEYGAQRRTVGTDVYRGQGEPGADTLWASAYGDLLIEGLIVPVKVTATSMHRYKATECSQHVVNSGTDIFASSSLEAKVHEGVFVQRGTTRNVYLPGGEFVFQPEPKLNQNSKLVLFIPSCDVSSWPKTNPK